MFFTISQNNSGGYFFTDHSTGVAEYIIIEAESAVQMREIFERIGEEAGYGFDEYCPCCGDRWGSVGWMDDDDGDEVASIYGTPVDDYKSTYGRGHACIHYLDGSIITVEIALMTEEERRAYYEEQERKHQEWLKKRA